MSEYLKTLDYLEEFSDKICIDTETFGENPLDWRKATIRLIQIKDETGKKCIIDVLKYVDMFEDFKTAVVMFLESRSLIIGHNLQFDLMFLADYGFKCPPNVELWDTYITELVIDGNPDDVDYTKKGGKKSKNSKKNKEDIKNGYRLEDLILKHFDTYMNKEEGKGNWGVENLTEKQYQYAINDVEHLFNLYEKQKISVSKEQLDCRRDMKHTTLEWVVKQENEFVKCVVMLQHVGLPLFKDYEKTANNFLKQNIEKLEDILEGTLPSPYHNTGFNVNSPKQVLSFLKDIVLPNVKDPKAVHLITKGGKSKKGTSNNEVMRRIIEDHPSIKPIMELKQLKKLESSLISQIKEKTDTKTNKVYPTVKQMGAKTGRISYSNPAITNLAKEKAYEEGQIVDKDKIVNIRKIFKAEKGRKFAVADWSQIEMCGAARIYSDKTMIRLLNEGKDLHNMLLHWAFKIPLDEKHETDLKKGRPMAKATNFGQIYGQGVKGLIDRAFGTFGIKMSEEQGTQLRKSFFGSYQDIERYQENKKKEVFGLKAIDEFTLMGRKRHITKPDESGTLLNTVLNSPIQGTCADMIKYTMNTIYRYIFDNKLDWKLILTVHDEVMLDVPESQGIEACLVLQYYMETCGSEILDGVPIKADPFLCDSWSDKTLENKKSSNCCKVYEDDKNDKTFGYKYTKQQKEEWLSKCRIALDLVDDEYENKELEEQEKKELDEIDFIKLVDELREECKKETETELEPIYSLTNELKKTVKSIERDPLYDVVYYEDNKMNKKMFELMDSDDYPTIIINSSTNTQKTIGVSKFLSQYKDSKMLFLSSRVTLCADLQRPLQRAGFVGKLAFKPYYEIKQEIEHLRNNDWKHYEKGKRDQLTDEYARSFKHKICQIESLGYYLEDDWEFVVADEFVSLLVQLTAPTNKDRYKINNDVFHKIIYKCRKFIGMDADWDVRPHLMIKTYRPDKKVLFFKNTITRDKILKLCPEYELINKDNRDKLIVRLLPSKPSYLVHDMTTYIEKYIDGKKGKNRKKIYGVMGSQCFGDKVRLIILAKYPNVRVTFVDKYADMTYIRTADFNEEVKKVDVFLSTSALSNGVNISWVIVDHIFVYGTNSTVTIRELKQMMDRVRYPIENTITACIRDTKCNKPTTITKIYQEMVLKLSKERTISRLIAAASFHPAIKHALTENTLRGFEIRLDTQDFPFQLFLLNRLEQNISKNNYTQEFINMWADRGVKVIQVGYDDDVRDEQDLVTASDILEAEDNLKEASNDLRTEQIIRFSLTEAPTSQQYQQIIDRMRRGTATTEDKHLKEKAQFTLKFEPIFQGLHTIDDITEKYNEIYKKFNLDVNSAEDNEYALNKFREYIKDSKFITAEQYLKCKHNLEWLKNSLLEIKMTEKEVGIDQVLIHQHNIFMNYMDKTNNVAKYKPYMVKLAIIRAVCIHLEVTNTYDDKSLIPFERIQNCLEWIKLNLEFMRKTFKQEKGKKGLGTKSSAKTVDQDDNQSALYKLKAVINAWCGVKLVKDKDKSGRLLEKDKLTGKTKQVTKSYYRLKPDKDIKELIEKLNPVDFYGSDYNKVKNFDKELTTRDISKNIIQDILMNKEELIEEDPNLADIVDTMKQETDIKEHKKYRIIKTRKQ